jgi:hypothetical protein
MKSPVHSLTKQVGKAPLLAARGKHFGRGDQSRHGTKKQF